MKKIKVLLCGLLVGLAVSSYLIVTQNNSATELFLLNVEALSLDESDVPGCILVDGFCFAHNGDFVRGMKYAD